MCKLYSSYFKSSVFKFELSEFEFSEIWVVWFRAVGIWVVVIRVFGIWVVRILVVGNWIVEFEFLEFGIWFVRIWIVVIWTVRIWIFVHRTNISWNNYWTNSNLHYVIYFATENKMLDHTTYILTKILIKNQKKLFNNHLNNTIIF